jgi:hypothetical protein
MSRTAQTCDRLPRCRVAQAGQTPR